MSLTDIARSLWAQIKNETADAANTATRVGAAGEALLNVVDEVVASVTTPALTEKLRDVFAAKESGVTNEAHTYTLTAEMMSIIVSDTSPDFITVISTITGGSVGLVACTADKGVTITVGGSKAVTIQGVSYAPGETVFASWNNDTQQWTVNSTVDKPIPDYSDMTVKHYSEGFISQVGTSPYYDLTIAAAVNDLVLSCYHYDPASIGVWQVYEVRGSVCRMVKKIDGKKLNVVRVSGTGKVVYSQFDGVNVGTLSFRELKDVYSKAEVDSKLNEVKQLAYAGL